MAQKIGPQHESCVQRGTTQTTSPRLRCLTAFAIGPTRLSMGICGTRLDSAVGSSTVLVGHRHGEVTLRYSLRWSVTSIFVSGHHSRAAWFDHSWSSICRRHLVVTMLSHDEPHAELYTNRSRRSYPAYHQLAMHDSKHFADCRPALVVLLGRTSQPTD